MNPEERHARAIQLCDELNADCMLAQDMKPFLRYETVLSLASPEHLHELSQADGQAERINELEYELADVKDDLSNAENEVKKLENAVQTLEDTLDVVRKAKAAEIEYRDKLIKETEAKFDDAQDDLNYAKSKLEDTENKVDELKQDINDLENERGVLRDEITDLRGEIRALESEKSEIAQALDVLEARISKIENL